MERSGTPWGVVGPVSGTDYAFRLICNFGSESGLLESSTVTF